MTHLRRPAFQGALPDVLPICIDIWGSNGEETEGIYIGISTSAIGRGAYDRSGHINVGFLKARDVGPYPREMQYAWSHTRLNATHNIGLTLLSSADEWGKLGPLANETPADVRSRGAAERRRNGVSEEGDSHRRNGYDGQGRNGGHA